MQAHAMERAGRDEPEAAAKFVSDRDADDQFAPACLDRLAGGKCGSYRRRTRMHHRFVVRVVEVHRVRERAVDHRGVRRRTAAPFA